METSGLAWLRSLRKPLLIVALTAMPILLLARADGTRALDESGIALSRDCPKGFTEREGGCYLVSPYRQYDSLENGGVGGLKSGLPPIREGFTPAQIDLGRYLFFDPILSSDGTVSCAHCHSPSKAFSDGLSRSRGVGGREVARHAPSLWNVGMRRTLFWDGRAHSLEEQMQGPLYSPREMGNDPADLLARLNRDAAYRRLFAEAFGRDGGPITAHRLYTAIAAFESSLVSLDSRYDLYANGVDGVLSSEEIEGLNVFRSFVARCAECHTPPLFTNQQIAVIGGPEAPGRPFDIGAAAVTHEPTQRGGFVVPSLRNVAIEGPYGHSGYFTRLRDAVEFYNLGRGHAVPKGQRLTLHWHIWEPGLSAKEIDALVAFLGTLTDESLMPAIPGAVPSGLRPGA